MAGNKTFAALLILLSVLFASCASMRTSGNNERDIIVRCAMDMIDKGYKYGSQDPEGGFDCSGLVQFAYKQAGIDIPRTASAQYYKTLKIDLGKAKEGDLVFFSTVGPGPTHVGIYLGGGKFIHAPSEGKKIRQEDMNNNYWKNAYYGAGTFFR
jgi:cell wall-associated NlpC family hydrolase